MRTVFFDVDTQLDFLYPAGALYVPGAERIVENVAALNRHATAHGIPVVSTMDAHAEDDPEFRAWPPHCVVETAGQQKPAATLLEKRTIVYVQPQSHCHEAQQYLVEKQAFDCFTNHNLVPLLDRLGAERCVVYGVVTEICVMHAAMGLLKTDRRVEVVTDAVQSLNASASEKFFRELKGLRGVLRSCAEVLG